MSLWQRWNEWRNPILPRGTVELTDGLFWTHETSHGNVWTQEWYSPIQFARKQRGFVTNFTDGFVPRLCFRLAGLLSLTRVRFDNLALTRGGQPVEDVGITNYAALFCPRRNYDLSRFWRVHRTISKLLDRES